MIEPYYSEAGITIYNADCRDVLPQLGPVDAVVTDPPFGIGFVYDGKREATKSPDTYWAWLEPIYRSALAAVRPGGFVAVWQAQINFRHFWSWFGDDIHIYCAAKNFTQMSKTPINYAYDPVVMMYKSGASPLRPAKPSRNADWSVGNTAAFVGDTRRLERRHPCPRPIDQVTTVLANFALPGGIVLDPFMGSGTTLRAAKDLGHKAIGIEISEAYCEIAARRLSQSVIDFASLLAGGAE